MLQVVWGAGTGQLPEAPPGVACRIVSLDQVRPNLPIVNVLDQKKSHYDGTKPVLHHLFCKSQCLLCALVQWYFCATRSVCVIVSQLAST
jgi:hypothetical protein